jgi:hypothetical protein
MCSSEPSGRSTNRKETKVSAALGGGVAGIQVKVDRRGSQSPGTLRAREVKRARPNQGG